MPYRPRRLVHYEDCASLHWLDFVACYCGSSLKAADAQEHNEGDLSPPLDVLAKGRESYESSS